ncbi:MAG: hypothetical protein MI810_24695 [Flavobacteriales bacterium]|jgi:hypothetical protein|nr:hypothetical protein [Flavobacteriales bacterium]
MKNLKKFALVCFFFGSLSSFSQDWKDGIEFSTATVSADYCVILDPTKPVAEWYEMDITDFGFTDETTARNQFLQRSNNLISYNVDLSEQKAYARVHLDRTPTPQDIVWWNNYLSTLCTSTD